MKRYKSIPLDENEGIYIRNIKTGRVEMIVGKSSVPRNSTEKTRKPTRITPRLLAAFPMWMDSPGASRVAY